MEIIWFSGNLEIWLRYDFNMPLVEDLFESGALQGHSARLGETEWRAPNIRLWVGFGKSSMCFSYCFHAFHFISIFFENYDNDME